MFGYLRGLGNSGLYYDVFGKIMVWLEFNFYWVKKHKNA